MVTSERDSGLGPVRLVSFVAFFTTLAIYSPNVMVLQTFDANGYIGYFAEPCLACALVAAVFVAVAAFAGRPHGVLRANIAVTFPLAMLYLAGNAGYALVTLLQPAGAAWLNGACALCAGIGTLFVCIAWARSLHDLDLCRSVLAIAVAGGLSPLCNIALSSLPASFAVTLYLVLLVAGIAWPVADQLHAPRSRQSVQTAPAAPPDAATAVLSLRAFCSVMGVPLLGMAISSFAMGVQPVLLFNNAVDAQRIGMVVGALALLPLTRIGGLRPVFSFIYQAYLPAAAVLVLVLCAFPPDSAVRDIALVAVYAFYAMTSGVAVAAAIAIANASEFPRSFVFATLVGAFCGMGILGIFLGARFSFLISNNTGVLVVLTALYGGLMLLSGSIKSWRLTARPATGELIGLGGGATGRKPVDQAAACVETFDERVARVACEAGLSPRETQIVGYIGRGHSSVYVAKTLLISESTVYSHVRNIYRKLGLSSREELIQLLNANGVSSCEHKG